MSGRFEFDVEKLDLFFKPIGPMLDAFATRHNLLLEKYRKYSPSWEFLFRHPQKGVARIQVLYKNDQELSVQLFWWYDDYDKCIRFSKSGSLGDLARNSKDLGKKLKEALQTVLEWKSGTWDHEQGGLAGVWKKFKKEEFDQAIEHYPTPRLD